MIRHTLEPMELDKVLADSLRVLGASDKEIRLIQASYELGPVPVPRLAQWARLERSTAYVLVKDLMKAGLLEEDYRNYRKLVRAAEPQRLLRMVADRQRRVRRQELELEEHLPQLQAMYGSSDVRPKVRVHEGGRGLLQVWATILAEVQEVLLWTNQEAESRVFTPQLHRQFVAERVSKRIPIRVLAVRNQAGEQLLTEDERSLRRTRLLPAGVDFKAETYIFGDCVALLDHQRDVLGIVVESRPFAAAQRAMFEGMWQMVEKVVRDK